MIAVCLLYFNVLVSCMIIATIMYYQLLLCCPDHAGDKLWYSSRLYRIFDSTIPSQATAVFTMTMDSKIYIEV